MCGPIVRHACVTSWSSCGLSHGSCMQFSLPKHRGRSIYVSERATIARRDGQLKFMIRVADIRCAGSWWLQYLPPMCHHLYSSATLQASEFHQACTWMRLSTACSTHQKSHRMHVHAGAYFCVSGTKAYRRERVCYAGAAPRWTPKCAHGCTPGATAG